MPKRINPHSPIQAEVRRLLDQRGDQVAASEHLGHPANYVAELLSRNSPNLWTVLEKIAEFRQARWIAVPQEQADLALRAAHAVAQGGASALFAVAADLLKEELRSETRNYLS